MNDSLFYRRLVALIEAACGLVVATDGAVSVEMYVRALGLPVYPTVLFVGIFLFVSGVLAFLTPVNSLFPIFASPLILLTIVSILYVATGGRGADVLKLVYAAGIAIVVSHCTWQHPFAGKKKENPCLTFKLN